MATSQLQYQCLNHVLGNLTKMSISIEVNKLGKIFMHPKYIGQEELSACTPAKKKKKRQGGDPLHVQIFRILG